MSRFWTLNIFYNNGESWATRNIFYTRQVVSSMIHSVWPIVTPVANIVFCCFVFLDLKSGDGRSTCAKTMTPTSRDFWLAEWINNLETKVDKNHFFILPKVMCFINQGFIYINIEGLWKQNLSMKLSMEVYRLLFYDSIVIFLTSNSKLASQNITYNDLN